FPAKRHKEIREVSGRRLRLGVRRLPSTTMGQLSRPASWENHMTRSLTFWFVIPLAWGVAEATLRAADPDPRLAEKGYQFLKKFCFECHGKELKKKPLDVGKRDLLVTHKRKKEPFHYLVPGKPDQSYLWQRVDDGDMPPEEATNKPTDDDKK